jgi:peptidoglycan/LPS O-acetylase OafA/YrhL
LEPLIFTIFFAFIILEQNVAKNSFLKFGRFRTFNYLGVRSYGLYCYHMIGIFCAFCLFHLFGAPEINHSFVIFLGEIILAFLLTVIFSATSYRFFEKKLLNLKEKYGYKKSSE